MNKNKILEDIMTRIMHIREMQEGYLACTTALKRRDRDYKQGDGKVFSDLMKWELDEWRNLSMWGLTGDQKTQDKIKSAVHERFLSDKMHVADWFHNGESPSSWKVSTEEEFRAMARKAFLGEDAP